MNMNLIALLLAGLLAGCATAEQRYKAAADRMIQGCLAEALPGGRTVTPEEKAAAYPSYMACVEAGLDRLDAEERRRERALDFYWAMTRERRAREAVSSGAFSYTPGIPVIDAYGRLRQFVPSDGGGGVPLGTITPNAYGPGLHMDATGRPVRSAPWP